jgi:hypothetical protein
VDRETGGAVLDRKRDFLYVESKTQYKISYIFKNNTIVKYSSWSLLLCYILNKNCYE